MIELRSQMFKPLGQMIELLGQMIELRSQMFRLLGQMIELVSQMIGGRGMI